MNSPAEPPTSRAERSTVVQFDLADVLTPVEVERFLTETDRAGAPDVTEHFLDLTLRLPGPDGFVPPSPSAPTHGTTGAHHPKAA